MNPASVITLEDREAKGSLWPRSLLFCASDALREATHHPAAADGRLKRAGASNPLSERVRGPGVTCSENRARPAQGPA